MAKQEASFWQITTLDLCLGGKSLLLSGLTFPICIVEAISQDNSEPSEVQWVGLWALGSSRWRPDPSSGASIWDLNHTPQLHLLQQPPQMLSRVDRNQGWGAGSRPLPRRTQRQESHCQACVHRWRNDEPEGWWERQLRVERPVPWSHGHAHPSNTGWARWWRQLRGGFLAPLSPDSGALKGPRFLSTQKPCGEKPSPYADLGQHFNLVESQL